MIRGLKAPLSVAVSAILVILGVTIAVHQFRGCDMPVGAPDEAPAPGLRTYELTVVDAEGFGVSGAAVEVRDVVNREEDSAALAQLLREASAAGVEASEASESIRKEIASRRATAASKVCSYVTDRLGSCRFVAPLEIEVIAQHDDYGTSSVIAMSAAGDKLGHKVAWTDTRKVVQCHLTLLEQARISGFLLSAQGEPITEAAIAVRCVAAPGCVGVPRSPGVIFSDETGAFEVLVDSPARVILECVECRAETVTLLDAVVQPGQELVVSQ